MKKWKEYLNIELIMTSMILLFVVALAVDGFFVKKLASSAMAFPGFVFLSAIVIGLLEIGNHIRHVNRHMWVAREADAGGMDTATAADREAVKPAVENPRNFAAICVMLAGYFLLLYLMGFVISSILFSLAFAGFHKYKRMALFTVLTVVIIAGWYFLFTGFLGVGFPTGLLIEAILG